MRLVSRKDFVFEFKRKMFHFVLGTVIAYAVFFLYPVYGNLILLPLFAALVVMRIIPRVPEERRRVSNHLIYHFEREKDRKEFPFKGAFFFGLGIIPPIVLLPTNAVGQPHLASAVIAILAGGDAFSTLVGKFYGRYRIRHKSVEGFIAFILSGYMMGTLFVDVRTSFYLSLVGAFIELFNTVDDNLAIPWGLTLIILLTDALFPGFFA